MSDKDLLELWMRTRQSSTTGAGFRIRGWYRALYKESMRGKKILDVGCGFGLDSINFAQHGARVSFVDLVATNVEVVKRLCQLLSLSDIEFLVLEDRDALNLLSGL